MGCQQQALPRLTLFSTVCSHTAIFHLLVPLQSFHSELQADHRAYWL